MVNIEYGALTTKKIYLKVHSDCFLLFPMDSWHSLVCRKGASQAIKQTKSITFMEKPN